MRLAEKTRDEMRREREREEGDGVRKKSWRGTTLDLGNVAASVGVLVFLWLVNFLNV